MAADQQYQVDPNAMPPVQGPEAMDPQSGGYTVSPSELEECLIGAMDEMTREAKGHPDPEKAAKLCQGVQSLSLAYQSIVTANTQAIQSLAPPQPPAGAPQGSSAARSDLTQGQA